jgi:hypothetical protein
MRERLFSLREDGSSVEAEPLRAFLPHWKRFTGWVAGAIAREHAVEPAEPPRTHAKASKAPLPAPRRVGAAVNLGAGEWAMTPGKLPAQVERYRWAMEDLRVTIFAPGAGAGSGAAEMTRLWADVEAIERDAARPKGAR